MSGLSAIDRANLQDLNVQYPNAAIVIENQFLGGTDKKPCGFVPNDWDGSVVKFAYKSEAA